MLTPLAIDPGHPFPHLRNKSLNLAVLLRRDGPERKRDVRETSLAVVQVPSVLAAWCRCPRRRGRCWRSLPLEELIRAALADLFPGVRGGADGVLPRHPRQRT